MLGVLTINEIECSCAGSVNIYKIECIYAGSVEHLRTRWNVVMLGVLNIYMYLQFMSVPHSEILHLAHLEHCI